MTPTPYPATSISGTPMFDSLCHCHPVFKKVFKGKTEYEYVPQTRCTR